MRKLFTEILQLGRVNKDYIIIYRNVLLTLEYEPKISDFGMSREATDSPGVTQV